MVTPVPYYLHGNTRSLLYLYQDCMVTPVPYLYVTGLHGNPRSLPVRDRADVAHEYVGREGLAVEADPVE